MSIYSVEILQAPNLLLETLIEDTFNNKVQWDTTMMDHGSKNIAVINIPETHKFLKFFYYEMGTATFIKTEFHKGTDWLDIIEFESINAQKERERLTRLGQAIKRQKDTRSSSDEYKHIKVNRLMDDIRRTFRNSNN